MLQPRPSIHGDIADTALDRIASWGTRLVITVDAASDRGRGGAWQPLGLDMIVTDHHSIQRDEDGRTSCPRRWRSSTLSSSPTLTHIKNSPGSASPFSWPSALLADKREPIAQPPVTLKSKDLLDLVALGTVADRRRCWAKIAAWCSAAWLNSTSPRRPGIQAMLEEAKVASGEVDATAIGFALGPRINAAGRLAHANLSTSC